MTDLKSSKIEWIFFDLGSTLIDETEAYAHRVRETIAGTNVSVTQFNAVMRRSFSQGSDGYKEALAFFHLQKTPWHSEDERPYPDCAAVLEALKARGYRLGVIANQVPGTAERLEKWGLLHFFDVVAASAEFGVAKPDPSIFLRALLKAGCRPESAVMTGDRIDNDILPSQALGMKAVRVLTGPAAVYRPADDPSDAVVCSLSALPDLF